MKWREPKIKGMVTAKNILMAIVVVLILSVPFGYVGGHRGFSVSVWLLELVFLSVAPLGIVILPLLPGTLVQLTEEMIVHGPRGTNSRRSACKEIECIYSYATAPVPWSRTGWFSRSKGKHNQALVHRL